MSASSTRSPPPIAGGGLAAGLAVGLATSPALLSPGAAGAVAVGGHSRSPSYGTPLSPPLQINIPLALPANSRLTPNSTAHHPITLSDTLQRKNSHSRSPTTGTMDLNQFLHAGSSPSPNSGGSSGATDQRHHTRALSGSGNLGGLGGKPKITNTARSFPVARNPRLMKLAPYERYPLPDPLPRAVESAVEQLKFSFERALREKDIIAYEDAMNAREDDLIAEKHELQEQLVYDKELFQNTWKSIGGPSQVSANPRAVELRLGTTNLEHEEPHAYVAVAYIRPAGEEDFVYSQIVSLMRSKDGVTYRPRLVLTPEELFKMKEQVEEEEGKDDENMGVEIKLGHEGPEQYDDDTHHNDNAEDEEEKKEDLTTSGEQTPLTFRIHGEGDSSAGESKTTSPPPEVVAIDQLLPVKETKQQKGSKPAPISTITPDQLLYATLRIEVWNIWNRRMYPELTSSDTGVAYLGQLEFDMDRLLEKRHAILSENLTNQVSTKREHELKKQGVKLIVQYVQPLETPEESVQRVLEKVRARSGSSASNGGGGGVDKDILDRLPSSLDRAISTASLTVPLSPSAASPGSAGSDGTHRRQRSHTRQASMSLLAAANSIPGVIPADDSDGANVTTNTSGDISIIMPGHEDSTDEKKLAENADPSTSRLPSSIPTLSTSLSSLAAGCTDPLLIVQLQTMERELTELRHEHHATLEDFEIVKQIGERYVTEKQAREQLELKLHQEQMLRLKHEQELIRLRPRLLDLIDRSDEVEKLKGEVELIKKERDETQAKLIRVTIPPSSHAMLDELLSLSNPKLTNLLRIKRFILEQENIRAKLFTELQELRKKECDLDRENVEDEYVRREVVWKTKLTEMEQENGGLKKRDDTVTIQMKSLQTQLSVLTEKFTQAELERDASTAQAKELREQSRVDQNKIIELERALLVHHDQGDLLAGKGISPTSIFSASSTSKSDLPSPSSSPSLPRESDTTIRGVARVVADASATGTASGSPQSTSRRATSSSRRIVYSDALEQSIAAIGTNWQREEN